MSKYKDIMKNGWHPEKPGTTMRGQVNGLLGRNKQQDRTDHVAAPLSSLKDPASFAPPPKRTGTGLAAAPPRSQSVRKVVAAPSKYQDPKGPAVAAPERITADPEVAAYNAAQHPAIEDAPKPSGPYQRDTSGLATDHLPPPPKMKEGALGGSPSPPSYENAIAKPPAARPVPGLPPRLPARSNTGGSSGSTGPPSLPSRSGASPSVPPGGLNQGAVSRLGAAGVNVPGFGIGKPSSPSPPPARSPAGPAQVNELQNKFSRLGTSATAAPATAPKPAGGSTWAEKQAALKTASSFQKDPSSVSMSDARSAASTANNFRQRHGDQVAAGLNAANRFNQNQQGGQESGVVSADGVVNTAPGPSTGFAQGAAGLAAIANKKKPAPPPPKKPKNLETAPGGGENDAPPPIPMSTRPTF